MAACPLAAGTAPVETTSLQRDRSRHAHSGTQWATRSVEDRFVSFSYGVLVAGTESAAPEVADLLGKVVGSGAPQLVSMAWAARDAAPRLVNTDGDRVCLVKATVALHDPDAAFAALAERWDMRRDGDALTWWAASLTTSSVRRQRLSCERI